MLVLTRKVDEVVRIGDDVLIKVVLIENNSVRIGIEAPPDISIRRDEIDGKRRASK